MNKRLTILLCYLSLCAIVIFSFWNTKGMQVFIQLAGFAAKLIGLYTIVKFYCRYIGYGNGPAKDDIKQTAMAFSEYTREAPGNMWQRAHGPLLSTEELYEEFIEYLKNKK